MSYIIKDGAFDVQIKLDKGLYRFPSFSSEGKSRLTEILTTCADRGYKVFAINYSGAKQLKRTSGDITAGMDVYLFDQYDDYHEEMYEEVLNLSKNAIVLLDVKVKGSITKDMKFCVIHMTNPDKITIVGGG